MIQNLVAFPSTVLSYHSQNNGMEDTETVKENPDIVSVEQLEPTSGRKLWKMKHHKRIKKKLKPFKNGFIGGS